MRNRFRGAITIARSYLRIARLLPTAGSGLVATLLALDVALGLLPVAFVVGTSVMIGRVPAAVGSGVGSAEWTSLVVAFAAAAGAFVLQQVLTPLQTGLGELMTRRVDGQIVDRLIAASLRSPGIAPLEDQRLLNDLSDAVSFIDFSYRTPGTACAALLALVARYLRLLGYVAVVAIVFSPIAALAILGAAMVFRTGNRGGLRAYSQTWFVNVAQRRKSEYLRTVAMQAAAGKEIRVFGLSGWLTRNYRATVMDWLMRVWAERRRIYFKPYLVYTAIGLVVGAASLAAMGQAAASGALTLTALALALQAALAALHMGEYFAEADDATQFGMLANDAVVRFETAIASYERRFAPELGHETAGPVPTGGATPSPAGMPRESIRFESVEFHYPGTTRTILDGLDLTIPAGRCTAIVGLNGAGKTTLVKLLARLYEPTAGRVAVDGANIASFAVDDWRRRIGIIFQDFNRYELSAAENVGFGAVELLDDRTRIKTAARKAGILGALERLPEGLDTPLARQYEGGADLSGGQWQRVAIARALFALEGGASILVLDEPTAALDVRAEAAFFDRFVELTRGVTSLLISHRFSSVRHADHIVVIEGGRVVEQGSHEGLLEQNGRYAELFRLQAERFTEEDEECEEVDLTEEEPDGAEGSGARPAPAEAVEQQTSAEAVR